MTPGPQRKSQRAPRAAPRPNAWGVGDLEFLAQLISPAVPVLERMEPSTCLNTHGILMETTCLMMVLVYELIHYMISVWWWLDGGFIRVEWCLNTLMVECIDDSWGLAEWSYLFRPFTVFSVISVAIINELMLLVLNVAGHNDMYSTRGQSSIDFCRQWQKHWSSQKSVVGIEC